MTSPNHGYDVVIAGGAVMGSSAAYFLSENPDFDGTVLVVEPDPTYARSSTALSAASIRHQFSNPINIAISQFCTEFIADFHDNVEVDGESPDLGFRETGYLFLATGAGMATLDRNHAVQQSCGVDASLLTPDEIQRRYPYMFTGDLAGASIGESNEGTLDANSLMQGFRQRARRNGVEYLTDSVVGVTVESNLVAGVVLASGRAISCGAFVNCAGPHGSVVASMAGLELPVEPRQRSVFLFDCREPLGQTPPLTIDTSGVWLRSEPPYYLAGAVPVDDTRVDHDDFRVRHDEFNEQIWPALAHRIPQFDKISVKRSWAGHYAYNTLDHNAVVGPAEAVPNFIFANGFSGHGLQQSAGVGRGVSELICYGEYRSLDLSELGHQRIVERRPFTEDAII